MTPSVPNDGLRGDNVGVEVLQNSLVNHENVRLNDGPNDCLIENLSNHQSEANCHLVVKIEKEDG